MANPLACAIAIESAKMLQETDMKAVVGNIESILKKELAQASAIPGVADVRVLGSIGVVEMKRPVDVGRFQVGCVRQGVWIRPFGKNVYLMPPYVITPESLRTLCRRMLAIIRDEKNY